MSSSTFTQPFVEPIRIAVITEKINIRQIGLLMGASTSTFWKITVIFYINDDGNSYDVLHFGKVNDCIGTDKVSHEDLVNTPSPKGEDF